MNRWMWVARSVVIALLLVSCRPTVGSFAETGYAHPSHPYEVRYAVPSEQLLMPADWQLDNLYETPRGVRAKSGADYESTLYLDVDGDGKSDDLGVVQTFDLLFTHRKSSASAWLRTVPVERDLREKDLRVLMGWLVEGISGSGYQVVQLHGELYAANKEQRYAAKVVRENAATLADKEAYVAVLDVANVDRLELDPKRVEERLMVVLVRTGMTARLRRHSKKRFPIMMIVCYGATPEDFDATLGDFRSLLERIAIGGATGFEDRASKPAAGVDPAAKPAEDAPGRPSAAQTSGL